MSGSVWQYMRLKKIAERKFEAECSLYNLKYSFGFTKFILPAYLIWIGITDYSYIMIAMAITFILSEFTEWFISKKYNYCAYLIDGNILVKNDYKVKKLNLEKLTVIDFSPWIDSFKLKFNDGQSVSIHRSEFDKNILNDFVKRAIEKSKFPVVIAEDAKSKIYDL
jgi:hypothetical protein